MLLWIAVPVVCVLALLAVPVDFVFDVERRERLRGGVQVAWLFGFVRAPIRKGRSKPKAEKPREKKRKRKSRFLKPLLKVIQRPAFRRRVLRLATDLLRSLEIRRTRMHAWVGLGDPADTGMMCASVVPVLAILRQHTDADVLLYPDFEDLRFEASGHGEIRVTPLALIWVLVIFAVSPAALRAGWTMLAAARA